MTAPTLPETLARLAQLLPGRVRAEMATDETETWVYRYEARRRGWRTVWWGDERPDPHRPDSLEPAWRGSRLPRDAPWRTHNLDPLEMALREECEARGWPAELTLNPPGMGRPHGAVIWSGGWHSGGMPSGPLHFGKSDTPAHALALALVSALEGHTG